MNLKHVRETYAHGKSQKQVADDLGIHFRTYQNWEQGVREPGMQDTIMLAKYFGCSLQEIIDEDSVQYAYVRLRDAQTEKLVRIFEQLPPEGRRALMACANGILTAYLE